MSFKEKFPNGPIPKGWLHCPPNGNHLIVSKFMPLKTPLNSNFDRQVPHSLRYYPDELFSLAKKNKVTIGLWVDLTNTNRYYKKEDVEQQGCKYVKIKCIGHGVAPTESDTSYFISVIHEHIIRSPFDCVAVHCTHGFNRTGFLISSFLIERLKFNVANALEMFSQSRPPGIYRENYIDELFRRYGEVGGTYHTPSLPVWCDKATTRKRICENSFKRKKRMKT